MSNRVVILNVAKERVSNAAIGVLILLSSLFGASNALSAPLSCDVEHQITADFNDGSGWEMCWTSTRQENIVLSEIHYRSSDQQRLKVISSIRLAQLHVTYDDARVTYNDVTQFGLGGGHISTLFESDCPEGDLIDISERAGLCKQISSGNTAFHADNETDQKEMLNLFSVSLVGSYAYLVTWKFYDDGTIKPSVGAAGALQRSSDHEHADYGRELEGTPDKVWLSHTHNYYWRIDFDIGENAQDDVVTEISYPMDDSGRRPKQEERLLNETARKINPENLTSWYITNDSDNILEAPGYLIEPLHYGHKLVRPANEPFTDFDLFITRQKDCERYINENTKFNPECGDDILQYTDNESLVNQDLVVWHRISFHHVPRNEDKQHMHSHWDGFSMQARNLSDSTPRHSGFIDNTAPSIEPIANQSNKIGDSIEIGIVASDADNDSLVYRHTDLPEGLSVSNDGVIQGEIKEAGHFQTTVQASDGTHTTSTHFNWEVEGGTKSGSGNQGLLVILAASFLVRRRLAVR